MEHQRNLLSALFRDFWSYASLILDPTAKRALEDASLKAGAQPPGRLPAPAGVGPASFTGLLEVAHRTHGAKFLRHAGHYCGSSAARSYEANVLSPSEGARRLWAELAAEWTPFNFEASEAPGGRIVLAVLGTAPLPQGLVEFVGGFVKGAAMRLNEGAVPSLEERAPKPGLVWATTVDWSPRETPEAAPVRPPTGGRRRPRR